MKYLTNTINIRNIINTSQINNEPYMSSSEKQH